MPYIAKELREKYDGVVTLLVNKMLIEQQNGTLSPGEINYIVSTIIWNLFDDKESYTTANTLIGVLECVKQEFIRRRLNNYEDEKISENGDL